MRECIGTGAYGKVYRSTSLSDEQFAVKVIPKKGMTRKLFKYLDSEAYILDKLFTFQNENIVQLIDKKESEHNYYMVFEYCNGGDLRDLLKRKGGKLAENDARGIIKQIVTALDLLYKNRIIHRDLKLANLFVHYPDINNKSEKLIIKLGDFGFATELNSDDNYSDANSNNSPQNQTKTLCDQYLMRSVVGTALTMSPEIMCEQPYSFKSDIWSLGMILYELVIGQCCFKGDDKLEILKNIQEGFYDIPTDIKLSLECRKFINDCLQYNPKNRISWEQILIHPFITGDTMTAFDEDTFYRINQANLAKNGECIYSDKVKYEFNFESVSHSSAENVRRTVNKRKNYLRVIRKHSQLNILYRKYSTKLLGTIFKEKDQCKSPRSVRKNSANLPCTPYRKNSRR